MVGLSGLEGLLVTPVAFPINTLKTPRGTIATAGMLMTFLSECSALSSKKQSNESVEERDLKETMDP
jgi:hypothetical protein